MTLVHVAAGGREIEPIVRLVREAGFDTVPELEKAHVQLAFGPRSDLAGPARLPTVVVLDDDAADQCDQLLALGFECARRSDLDRSLVRHLVSTALARARVASGLTRRIFAVMRDIVLFVDPATSMIVDANEAAIRAYGYAREELVGISVFRLRDDPNVGEAQLVAADREGVLFETVHRRKDGSTLEVEVSTRGDVIDGRRLVISIIRDVSRRKRAERELARSERRLRTVFESSPVGIAIVDSNGHLRAVNAAFCELVGQPASELVGQRHAAIPASPHRDVQRYARTDGTQRWVHAVSRPFFEVESDESLTLVATLDVTETKLLEDELAANERLVRTLGDNLPDSVLYRYVRDPTGPIRFEYISAGVERITGISVETALRDPAILRNQVLPNIRELFAESESRSERDLSDFEMEVAIRRTDSALRWLHLRSRPTRRPDGATAWDGVFTDVTARRQVEEDLRTSELRFRSTFETNAIGICHLDKMGRLQRVNDALCTLLGYRREELVGLPLAVLLPDAASRTRLAELFDGTRDHVAMEVRYVTSKGASASGHLTLSAARDSAGEATHFVGFLGAGPPQ